MVDRYFLTSSVATEIGVFPSLVVTFISAPFEIRYLTISRFPNIEATCNEENPLLDFAFISKPIELRNSTTEILLENVAACNKPYPSSVFGTSVYAIERRPFIAAIGSFWIVPRKDKYRLSNFAFLSAPIEMRYFNTSRFPDDDAICIGVTPNAACASLLAPIDKRYFTISRLPDCDA